MKQIKNKNQEVKEAIAVSAMALLVPNIHGLRFIDKGKNNLYNRKIV